MGILDGLGTGLAAIQQRNEQRDAAQQDLLIQLATQLPELMQNPEFARSVQTSFPYQSGITTALSALPDAREQAYMAQQEREKQRAMYQADFDLAKTVELKAAQLGVSHLIDQIGPESSRDELLLALGELSGLEQEKAAASAEKSQAAEFSNDVAMELLKQRGRERVEGIKAGADNTMWNAIGTGLRAFGVAASNLVDTPRMTPGAEAASKAQLDILKGRMDLGVGRLLQIYQLDQELGDKSPGLRVLDRLLKDNPVGFERTYGMEWENAKETAAQTIQTPEVRQSILAQPEVAELYLPLLEEFREKSQILAQQTQASQIDPNKLHIYNQFSQAAGGREFPEIGGAVMPPDNEYSPPSPGISFEQWPSEVQSLWLEAQDFPDLQQGYQTIIQMSDYNWDVARQTMELLRSKVEYYADQQRRAPQPQVPPQ